MRKAIAAAMAVLMSSSAFVGTTAGASAADRCAKAEDITAMQASAVQQQLMVAALSCDALKDYNAFVTAYQPELYAADRALLKFFKRMKARGGEADYHAFKTQMANMSSNLSIRDINTFCNNSRAAFALALGPTRSTLAAFVATQPIMESSNVATCEIRVAGGIVPGAPKVVPVPLMKPGTQTGLLPAIGGVVTGTVEGVTGVVGGIFSTLGGKAGGTQ
jgi:hypothetical protein